MKVPPARKVHVCNFCTPGVTHIIDPTAYPNDSYAEKTPDGKWRCGNCIDNYWKERKERVKDKVSRELRRISTR